MTNILLKKTNDFNKTFISWSNVQGKQKTAFNSLVASTLYHLTKGNYEPLETFIFSKNNIPNSYKQAFKRYLQEMGINEILKVDIKNKKITKNKENNDIVLETITEDYLYTLDIFKYEAKTQPAEWLVDKKVETLLYAYIKNIMGVAKKEISPQIISTAKKDLKEIINRI